MLGRFVPLLPRLLHAIPIIDVLRGPARHNFELGLSTSVLAAFGFDVTFFGERPTRPSRHFVVAAAGAGAVFAAAHAMRQSALSLPEARGMVAAATQGWVLFAALCFAFGFVVAACRGGDAWPFFAAAALAAPVVEARCSTRLMDRLWQDYGREIAQVVAAAGNGAERLLPMPAPLSRLPGLGGDSTLYAPRAQSIYAYASMANRDAATLLDLDMHGYPLSFADLAWSRLPSISA